MKLKRYISEASSGFIVQEYIFKRWERIDKATYRTLVDARKAAQKKFDNVIAVNKRGEKGFGTISTRLMRVVDLYTKEKLPATEQDRKQFKGMKKEYLQ